MWLLLFASSLLFRYYGYLVYVDVEFYMPTLTVGKTGVVSKQLPTFNTNIQFPVLSRVFTRNRED